MSNTSNAFSDMFKNTWDFGSAMDTQRRNAEAWAAAGQTMAESVQEVSRRQAELVRDNVEHTLQASKEIFSGGSPEESLSKQADFTRDLFESNLATMREVFELFTKSGFEAFDVVNKRAAENMEELSNASAAAKPKAAKTTTAKKS